MVLLKRTALVVAGGVDPGRSNARRDLGGVISPPQWTQEKNRSKASKDKCAPKLGPWERGVVAGIGDLGRGRARHTPDQPASTQPATI